jgi:hexosaminidase
MIGRALAATVALAGLASSVSAQPAVGLRWEFVDDLGSASVSPSASRAALTLTNRGSTRLDSNGWSIYFNVVGAGRPVEVLTRGVRIEPLQGDLFRLVPAEGFNGLGPGESFRVEYRTLRFLANIALAPTGPYLTSSTDPGLAKPLDYVVVPFERPTGSRFDSRVVTPEAQYASNERTRDLPPQDLPLVFPTPLRIERQAGRLRLAAPPEIDAPTELDAEAALARDYVSAVLRPRSGASGRAASIRLFIGKVAGQESPEAYELVIDPVAGIRITGATEAGVFYGLQTLRTLLPPQPVAELSLPTLRVVDAPRFAYRGLMLDVARNFQTKETVLSVLELMARYKLNALHFHLTDDEGWRLAMPSLPELTDVGARRGHTVDAHVMLPPAFGSGPDPNNRFGSGYYSRSDYIEIIRRAHALHIDVVPEIEMPGHARAAIEAMEARFGAFERAGDLAAANRFRLKEPDDRSLYLSAQQYADNVMNPALESTYTFIDAVVSEIVQMHRDAGVPLRSVHVGGDEVPSGVWEQSPAAQRLRVQRSLQSARDLWSVFYTRVEAILASHRLSPSGWEEVGVWGSAGRAVGTRNYGVSPEFSGRTWRLYAWNNLPGDGAQDLAYRLANGGYQVVLTLATHLYFDNAYNKNPAERGRAWAGYVDVEKPFQLVPLDYYRSPREDRFGNPFDAFVLDGKERLTVRGRQNIVGIQASLWSETLSADGRLEYMLLPKLFGLAERAWAPEPEWAQSLDKRTAERQYVQAWSSFANVIGKHELPRLAAERPDLGYRIPTPGLHLTPEGAVLANLQLPGFELRFTTDGTEPTVSSARVRGPIRGGGIVTVAAFDSTGRKGLSARVVH